MSSYIYDTRFFIEYFYSKDNNLRKKLINSLRNAKRKIISIITLHEIYKLTLDREVWKVVKLRYEVLNKDY